MANDKRKYYKRWVEAHKELSEKCDPPAGEAGVRSEKFNFYPLAQKAIDNFEANEAIYNELQYYKEEGVILGEHPIFIRRNLRTKIDTMSMGAAAVRKTNLENYIRRDTRAYDKAITKKNTEETNKLDKKITAWKIELGLILAKLGN